MKLEIPAAIRKHEGALFALVAGAAAVIVVARAYLNSSATAAAATAPSTAATTDTADTTYSGASDTSTGGVTGAAATPATTATVAATAPGTTQAPVGGTTGIGTQAPNSGGGSANQSPGTQADIPYSSTPAANEAFIASAQASGALVPQAPGSPYLVQNPAVPYTAAQQEELLTISGPQQTQGNPSGAATPSTAATPAGAFTGVQGLSTANGSQFLYQVFKNGTLVASVLGPANQDTVALGKQYGVG